ncbi:YfiH family protein [Pseudoduganella flava]|uniref:Polyphenol oxidoreductase n=1 Tax=Pseudoduganella flava TaxID=871742 RepID=A0A562PI16_9BURK|nr:polyphenol oxidase family protein [Pseudoduganella flava]QGZ42500.1 polyphenol oxidoreductase [Pseudoduganella flava]TWI43646.1 YfiH family protein [Pseudoduganella flava]
MITSRLLSSIPNIVHGFGTEAQLVPHVLQPVWDLRPDKRQVHGTRFVRIDEHCQPVGDADAFHTRHAGIPVSVIAADCVPLLLARRDGAHVAAVHAGWRGLADGIIPRVLADVEAGAHWVAAIGPTICADCYEVSEELALEFARRFADIAPHELLPRHRHLNLRAVAEHQLRQAGVTDIDHVGGCTCCARDEQGTRIFRSYRRGDRNSQQHAGLYIDAGSK